MADIDTTPSNIGLKAPSGDFSSFIKSLNLPTPQETVKEKESLLEQEKAARQPYLDKADALLNQVKSLNEAMQQIKAPKEPELPETPAAPTQKYQDPTQAIGGLSSVLSMLGGLKTRAPLTSALNSAASAMKAFHQGDVERAQLERQNWEDKLREGLMNNQREMQKYTTALQKANFDINKAQSAFRVIAAEEQNNSMHAAIEARDYQAQIAIIDGGAKAGTELVKAFLSHQDKEAQIAATKAYRQSALEQTAAIREQTHQDRLMMFDARYGTNLSGAASGAPANNPRDEKITREIDDLIAFVKKNPSVVGMMGYVRRGGEAISGELSDTEAGQWLTSKVPILKGQGMDPLHQNFGSKLDKLKLDIQKSLIGGGQPAKWKMQMIDEIVRGKNVFDTPQGAIDALQMLKQTYGASTPAGAGGDFSGGTPKTKPTVTNW